MSDLEKRRRRAAADVHMNFVVELYRLQMSGGRYFLHEHPAYAQSWAVPSVEELMDDETVGHVIGDQCQYGQATEAGEPLEKPTRFMSNSSEVLKELGKRCAGRSGQCSTREGATHGATSGRDARRAARYPFALCRAILRGTGRQLRKDGKLSLQHVGVQPRMGSELEEHERVDPDGYAALLDLGHPGGAVVGLSRRYFRPWCLHVLFDVCVWYG
jgi:hypothetical protein